MMHLIKHSSNVLYRAGYNLIHNDGIELAGYLTFLSMLALFPLLVLIISAFGFIGQGEAGVHLVALMIKYLPQDAVAALMPRIEEITSGPPQGLLTVAILGAIWTSSSAVEGLRTVLNRAYQVSEPPHFFLRRLVSIAQILVFTITLMIVMLSLVFAPIGLQSFSRFTGISVPLEIEQFITESMLYIGAGILFVGVASLYYVLPNIKQSLLAVVPGAALVVALWIGGAAGVTLYLENIDSVNVIYGSLSGIIGSMIFFFVMNVIFIYGAEFNHALLVALGLRIIEREHPND